MSSADELDPDEERWIRELLAAQPRPELPADVAARIDDALAAESQHRLSFPDSPARRGFGRGRWLAVAAAAAVVVGAGVVTIPRLTGTSETTAAVPAAAPPATSSPGPCPVAGVRGADIGPLVTESGTTYSAMTLQSQAEGLVRSPGSGCLDHDLSVTADSYSVASPQVRSCVVAAARGRLIAAVDLGWYDRRRAVTVVLLSPDEALALDCSSRPVTVLARTALPAAAVP